MTAPAEHRRPVVRFEVVDSTQRHAARLIADGAADGTAVVAETQTEGRGRRGRVWSDTPGASLLMSVLLRTTLPPSRVPTLSLAAGVAVVDALASSAGIGARLKWPNDVLVGGRKVAGILLERHGGAVVLGIGINVTTDAVPPDLAARATSIVAEGGRPDREALLAAVLEAVERWRGRLEREGFAPIRVRWTELAATIGQRVSVDGLQGLAVGLDDDGALVLATASGRARVLAGDVVAIDVAGSGTDLAGG